MDGSHGLPFHSSVQNNSYALKSKRVTNQRDFENLFLHTRQEDRYAALMDQELRDFQPGQVCPQLRYAAQNKAWFAVIEILGRISKNNLCPSDVESLRFHLTDFINQDGAFINLDEFVQATKIAIFMDFHDCVDTYLLDNRGMLEGAFDLADQNFKNDLLVYATQFQKTHLLKTLVIFAGMYQKKTGLKCFSTETYAKCFLTLAKKGDIKNLHLFVSDHFLEQNLRQITINDQPLIECAILQSAKNEQWSCAHYLVDIFKKYRFSTDFKQVFYRCLKEFIDNKSGQLDVDVAQPVFLLTIIVEYYALALNVLNRNIILPSTFESAALSTIKDNIAEIIMDLCRKRYPN